MATLGRSNQGGGAAIYDDISASHGFEPVFSSFTTISGQSASHFTGRNFTHIGEGTSTVWPVGVSRPVFLSIRKTTMLLLF